MWIIGQFELIHYSLYILGLTKLLQAGESPFRLLIAHMKPNAMGRPIMCFFPKNCINQLILRGSPCCAGWFPTIYLIFRSQAGFTFTFYFIKFQVAGWYFQSQACPLCTFYLIFNTFNRTGEPACTGNQTARENQPTCMREPACRQGAGPWHLASYDSYCTYWVMSNLYLAGSGESSFRLLIPQFWQKPAYIFKLLLYILGHTNPLLAGESPFRMLIFKLLVRVKCVRCPSGVVDGLHGKT
jgi:hypothetical protein